MKYSRGSGSLENLKLILSLVLIVFLSVVVFWVFTHGPIISIDNIVNPSKVPPEKNNIIIDEEIGQINFSNENLSEKKLNSIYLSDSSLYSKAIYSSNGSNWKSVNMLGDRSGEWIIASPSFPSNIDAKYVGLYYCKKDMRIFPLIAGIWDCKWSFRELAS